MCLLTISMSSLEECLSVWNECQCLFRSSANFLTGLFFSDIELYEQLIYFGD